MSLNYIEIGRNISTARKAMKMSQSKLALEIGIEQGYLSRIENGIKPPNLEIIVNIANTLGTGVDVLLGSNLATVKQKKSSALDMLISNYSPYEKDIIVRLFTLVAEYLYGHLK